MTFHDDNRIATFKGPSMGSPQSVSNDDDGNLTSGPLTNDTFVTYGYDARNRLTNAAVVSYAYDPAGNRVGITNGASVTRFVINPNAALSQVLVRVKGGVTNYYVYGLGLLYEVTESATATNTLTYHYDYRGSTVALTDSNGNVTDRMEYSAYATTTYRSGTNDTPFLFNGRYGVQTDPTGLLYMRARYYNPYLCRFLNPDPAGFSGGLNFYAFANGNPVSYRDPSGLGAVGDNQNLSWLTGSSATPMDLSNPFGLGTTEGLIGSAGVFEQAGLVRDSYNAWVAQYVTDSGGYSPTRDAIRAYFNQPGNSTALSRGIEPMWMWEQNLYGITPSQANPTATASAINNAAAWAKWGGRGCIVVGVGFSAYDVATAPDPYRATAGNGAAIVGGTGGATAGAAGGAFIGSFFGPGPGTAIGAVVGAVIGGVGGGMGGHALGTAAYDANYGPNSPWYP
jgi:RHS repeat-associated protein